MEKLFALILIVLFYYKYMLQNIRNQNDLDLMDQYKFYKLVYQLCLYISICVYFIRSREWSLIPDSQKDSIGLTFDDDGEFWMSFDDFSKNFEKLEICNLGPDSLEEDELDGKKRWEGHTENGEWIPRVNAGGCRNYLGQSQEQMFFVLWQISLSATTLLKKFVIFCKEKNYHSQCKFICKIFMIYSTSKRSR